MDARCEAANSHGRLQHTGILFAKSLIFRTYAGVETQIGVPGDFPAKSDTLAGTAIYMGVLPRQYGHFILEGLSRAWFAKQRPDLPVVWSVEGYRHGGRPRSRPAYTAWQIDIRTSWASLTNRSSSEMQPCSRSF